MGMDPGETARKPMETLGDLPWRMGWELELSGFNVK